MGFVTRRRFPNSEYRAKPPVAFDDSSSNDQNWVGTGHELPFSVAVLDLDLRVRFFWPAQSPVESPQIVSEESSMDAK